MKPATDRFALFNAGLASIAVVVMTTVLAQQLATGLLPPLL